MLTPQALERTSRAYRRGYADGYQGKEALYTTYPGQINPFAPFDYDEGYQAGANDAKWDRQCSNPEEPTS